MEDRFKIKQHRESGKLHLNLSGEFTDTSICDLIDVIKSNSKGVKHIFINTGYLDNINTSNIGRDVFQKNIRAFNDSSLNIKFSGNQTSQIIPENMVMQ